MKLIKKSLAETLKASPMTGDSCRQLLIPVFLPDSVLVLTQYFNLELSLKFSKLNFLPHLRLIFYFRRTEVLRK